VLGLVLFLAQVWITQGVPPDSYRLDLDNALRHRLGD